MISMTSDARFLGVDLRALGSEVRQAWAYAQGRAPLSWFTPAVPVRLLQTDGNDSLWRGSEKQAGASEDGRRSHIAVELPEAQVLQVPWRLPPISAADVPGAIALHARSVSPFADADMAWGYRTRTGAGGAVFADIAIASRKQVAQYLQSQAGRLPRDSAAPEVWVLPAAGEPIVLQGFGEGVRDALAARGRRFRYLLVGTACVILGALAVTPSLQLRMRALDAYAQHEALVRKTSGLVAQREALMKAAEGLGALAELQAGRIEPLRVLDKLTRALPDDTALQSFVLKEQKVTIAGLTANASALMQLLTELEGVRDVRAPTPATRSGGEAKENFTIEFAVDPKIYGVAPVEQEAAASTAAAASSESSSGAGAKP